MSIARKVNGVWQNIAGSPTIDDDLSATSVNPVQNKVIYEALGDKIDTSSVGAANGVAELNSNGKVPGSQLPTFVGTTAEWNALTSAQQAVYDERILTDDTVNTRGIDSAPTENSTNLVTSGGVYTAIAEGGGGDPFDFSDLDFVTTGLTYANAEYFRGGYIKVGSVVFVNISIRFTSTPTSTFSTHPEISGFATAKDMFVAVPWVDNYGRHGVVRMSPGNNGMNISWPENSGAEQGGIATITFTYIAAD